MHIMQIMQYRPWTASQHRALASFLRVCIIMLFCCAGPWFVLPPCCFIQFLWASSGASTFVLSVSPQRAMSFDAYLMLCIFSVSQMRLLSLFRYGKSCAHPRRNLSSTKWSHCMHIGPTAVRPNSGTFIISRAQKRKSKNACCFL